jgi:hypothetical protein
LKLAYWAASKGVLAAVVRRTILSARIPSLQQRRRNLHWRPIGAIPIAAAITSKEVREVEDPQECEKQSEGEEAERMRSIGTDDNAGCCGISHNISSSKVFEAK